MDEVICFTFFFPETETLTAWSPNSFLQDAEEEKQDMKLETESISPVTFRALDHVLLEL